MALFDFFRRRRERESAITGSEVSALAAPDDAARPEPVGEVIPGAEPQPIELNLGSGQTDVAQVIGMVGEALRSGQLQVAHAENRVLDLREASLREEILEAMRRSGIDLEAAAGGQVNAADHAGLQAQILAALESHGVDIDGPPGDDADSQRPPGEDKGGDDSR